MRTILEDTDWSELLSESDIDKSWEALTTKLNEAISVCVSYRYRVQQERTNENGGTKR